MRTVFVLSKSGKPLMPTKHCDYVRILLKRGLARVVEVKPFTIQLLYDTTEYTQPLYLGIDPGRTNIGAACVDERGNVLAEFHVTTRNKDIPKLMKKRKAHRQQRRKLKRRDKRRRRARKAGTVKAEAFDRFLPHYEKPIVCHDIRNKEARFLNRKRPKGWLTPTANHLLTTHENVINLVKKYIPVTHVVLEINKFAFMQLDNPNIQRWQYQEGPLKGFLDVKDAVYEQQEGHCIFCDKKIDHYHHVVPRRKNGSETLENRVGLCKEHHDLVHKSSEWEARLKELKEGMNKEYHALSVLNQIIPFLAEDLASEYGDNFFVTSGEGTKVYRDVHGIEKTHENDAACIAASVTDVPITLDTPAYEIRQFRRHDRQACHQQKLDRVYLQDGKAVATNRHKATDQKKDSLEEYRKTHTEQEISSLTVEEHPARYKDMHRYMPGSRFLYNGELHTLTATHGKYRGQPCYYVDESSQKLNTRMCIFIKKNAGLCLM